MCAYAQSVQMARRAVERTKRSGLVLPDFGFGYLPFQNYCLPAMKERRAGERSIQ